MFFCIPGNVWLPVPAKFRSRLLSAKVLLESPPHAEDGISVQLLRTQLKIALLPVFVPPPPGGEPPGR
jgi:hypothetical protein